MAAAASPPPPPPPPCSQEYKADEFEACWGADSAAVAVDVGVEDANTKHTTENLDNVSSNFNGHEVQLWRHGTNKIVGPLTSAVLKVRWADQGWGNQKGHLHARVDGGKWQRVTKHPAPHSSSRLEIPLPEAVYQGHGLIELG